MRKIIKCVVAGDGAVGKSTFLAQLNDSLETRNISVTVGLDVDIYHLSKDVTLQIWDLGGQKQYRFFQGDLIKSADIIFYFYSVEWFHSFLNLDDWINFIASKSDPKIQYLIGNKIDTNNRAVQTELGQAMAENLEFRHFEISARNSTGIPELMDDLKDQIQKLIAIKAVRHC